MHQHKILNIASPNPETQDLFRQVLGFSNVFAQVLINRGLTEPKEAVRFIAAKLEDLSSPFCFSQMKAAVERIKSAIRQKDKILVYGDYDVDGITSIALVKSVLLGLGASVIHYIPDRIREGYGLNRNILNICMDNNVSLLLTVDCGTNSREEISSLINAGIDVIITDHHELSEESLPRATAIINPKIKESGYAFRDLAGVGVAYKLCQALTGRDLVSELDLVTLGTIADVVPLVGENRIIVKEGLLRLPATAKLGISALIEAAGIKNRSITTTHVGYILGPRINASGRIAHADSALKLLLSQDPQEAMELADELNNKNRQRQGIENKILDEAQGIIDREVNFKEHKVIVIAKEDWHEGVLGIVASKLADRFYRPTVLISISEDHCKGSARSIKNFHLFNALIDCKSVLESFGGHSHAAGLLIAKDNIDSFRKYINDIASQRLDAADLIPCIDIDAELGLADINNKVIGEIESLEPFGAGNPEPLFLTRGLKLKSQPCVLSRDTLKFWVTDGKVTYQAIGFGLGSLKGSLMSASSFDLVYTPAFDNWRGQSSTILEARDIFFNQ
ncbi:MAG: single-stranded-DNA-specific exonuclease RecJ [Candidatus Omnitrophota bacterium]|jgi:single-stranded-DNA-specific exonuclease|nr:MAG: single-stranded-DNA-specific exonuclease RecJ [Candidatus Omnitrophota bacterium]